MDNAPMKQSDVEGSTPVTRSNETLVLGLAAGLLLGCLSIYLWSTEHGGWSFLVAVLALGLALVGLITSWKANCPACQTPLNGLSSGVCGPCGNCMHYLKMRNKRIFPLEVDYSQSIPWFAIPWDSLDRMPQRCCGCGQDAVRMEAMSSRAVQGLLLSAKMPHCGACRKGASIQQGTKVTNASATADPSTYMSIAVKSHRFYHEAMMMNHGAYSKRSPTIPERI